MTVYYTLALVSGIFATAVSFYGIKHESFPGKSIVPVVALTAVLSFGTLGAVIKAGVDERAHEAHAEKAEGHGGEGSMIENDTVIGNETVIEEGKP